MTAGQSYNGSRRAFLQALLAVPLLSMFRARPDDRAQELVEVDGWILKRSDLA